MVIYEERITLVWLQGPTRLKNKFIFMSNIFFFKKRDWLFFCLFFLHCFWLLQIFLSPRVFMYHDCCQIDYQSLIELWASGMDSISAQLMNSINVNSSFGRNHILTFILEFGGIIFVCVYVCVKRDIEQWSV